MRSNSHRTESSDRKHWWAGRRLVPGIFAGLLVSIGLVLPSAGVASASSSSSSSSNGSAPAVLTSSTSCKGTVKFGIAYISDGDQAAAQASGQKITAAGQNAYALGIQDTFTQGLAYLNKHGGWDGCKVTPVFYQFHILGNDFNEEDQEMCTAFASAHVTYAMNWTTNDTPLLLSCLSKHKIPIIWESDQFQLDNQLINKYAGFVYQPWGISYNRWGTFITALKTEGYLTSSSKVGIIVANNGAGAENYLANSVWAPALKKLGIPVTVFTYDNILGFQDLSDVSTDMASAVLKFRAAGVNDVMFTPSASVSTLEFSVAAASQNYFPAYGGDALEALNYLTPAERVGSAIVEWLPGSFEIPPEPASVGASDPPDAARTLCKSIYPGNTAPPYNFCDAMFFIQDAVKKSGSVTAAGLKTGVGELGTSFQSADGFGPTNFSNGQAAGGTEIRVMKWSVSQAAWVYATGVIKVPN